MPCKPKMTRRYVASALDDVEAMFGTALRMSVHKLSRGKLPLKPVFKDSAQRDAFNAMAKVQLQGLGKGQNTDRFRALSYLEARSQPNSSKTRMDLRGINNPRPRVYFAGHGLAGNLNFMSRAQGGEVRSTAEAAAVLSTIALPSESELRLPVCYSGAGASFTGPPTEWIDHLEKGTLSSALKSERSLAADLQRRMKADYGFKGTTAGYYGEVVLVPVHSGTGAAGQEKHFYVTPPRRKNNASKRSECETPA